MWRTIMHFLNCVCAENEKREADRKLEKILI